LTLSPALCAILLRPQGKGRRTAVLPRPAVAVALGGLAAWLLPPLLAAWTGPIGSQAQDAVGSAALWWSVRGILLVVGTVVGWPLAWLLNLLLAVFFRLFNLAFQAITGGYTWVVGWGLRASVLVLLAYGGLVLVTYNRFQQLPLGYIPNQDQGKFYVSIQTPDATSLERTRAVVKQVDEIVRSTPGVAHTIAVAGQSFTLSAYGSNFGQFFVSLDDFHERTAPGLSSDAIIARLRERIEREVPEASVAVLGPPPVSGLGNASGFKIMIEDRRDLGINNLQEVTDKLIAQANEKPELSRVFTISRVNSPQVLVDVNREQVAARGLALNDVFTTMQVYLGSAYVNDFNRFDHTWQVNVQAIGKYRKSVDNVRRLKVRNTKGDMVPLGAVTDAREINGPLILTRYNMYPAITVNGGAKPGVSSGEAIAAMAKLADSDLPKGMAFEWTEITLLQLLAGNTAMLVFALAVVGVFLVLAALYESWALPLAIILVVPMCLLGSITGVALSGPGADINIFTQVGFVVLVGLASKNAILIVEFAKLKREAGLPRREATLEACKLRLRPILMTSFAFILGVLPLMLAQGAGAEMRRILGTAVFSGMVGVTVFGIFLTPVFFYVIDRITEASLFGSRRVRLLLAVIFGVLGLGALAGVELLLVASWRNGVLSLGGLLVLSTGLFGVVVLVTIREWLRRRKVRLAADLIKTLWYRRGRARALAHTNNRTVPADSNGAALKHAIQALAPPTGDGETPARNGD
jgi:multidrug efflux pump